MLPLPMVRQNTTKMKPLPHQIPFQKGYADKRLLAHEGGTGKTVCACLWLKDGRDADALVVCPKRVVRKWRLALSQWGTRATVLSMEEFKLEPLKKWSARVIDEADEFAAPLFVKGQSDRGIKLYELVKAYPDTPTLLLTATPVRSNPWNLHSILCFIGIYIEWKKWRSSFFVLERRPYLRFAAWFPKANWRPRMRKMVEKYADIVLLRECVGYLPPITEHTLQVPPSPFKGATALTPSGCFVEEHKHEQEKKVKAILDIAKQYRKVLVVAHYTEQVEALGKALGRDRETFTVWGKVRDQEKLLEAAQASDECFLVVQASLGAGFDADTFSCIIFASMSYKARDFVQMKYRIRRIYNLHPVEYNYLMGGRCDKQVYKTVMLGKDFIPSEWK